jgi:ferrochelatase
MSATCDYQEQFEELASLVAERERLPHFSVAYQSRSGPPTQPWLEPDVLGELERLTTSGVRNVVLCPIGFVHDHMEVIWDLDIEAKQRGTELGLTLVRARTAGSHPKFVAMVHELVKEQTQGVSPRALGRHGPRVAPCRPGCCPAAQRPAPPRSG